MGAECCEPQETTPSSAGNEHAEHGAERIWQVRKLQLAAVAAALLAAGWAIGQSGAAPSVHLGFELAAAIVGAASFVPGAVRHLLRRSVGVSTLMTIAAVGAVALGQIEEAAMLGVLFSIAEGLEHYAVARTRRGLRALLGLVPPAASVLRGGVEQRVSPDALVVGDRMILRPGERAATDGVIRSGRTSLDLSAITGESVPVEAGPGETAFAGAINGDGAIEVDVTAPASDSSLARIVHVVEEAQERKGRGQRLTDRVARPLVPGIMTLAVVIAGLGPVLGDPLLWVERALVVLVAASPCALAISVPLTVVAAVGAASRTGALVKGGAALEELGSVGTVALDKTGTLTRNSPRVVEVVAADGTTSGPVDGGSDEVLVAAAALEARSEHPLARAILTASGDAPAADEVTAVPGNGLCGWRDGSALRLGKPGWIAASSLADEVERLQRDGATVVLVEADETLLGAIAVRDELREEVTETVEQLRGLDIDTAMLTGDNPRTASALANRAGITTVHSGLSPEGKARLLGSLRDGRKIAMVGDGVNDAPALATADVGIAMGAMGTDVAIDTADVALMGEDLRHLPRVLAHARHARGVMRQNVGLSLAIITVLIPLAAFGVMGLASVVLLHELAEVLVIANALRAARARPLPQATPVPAATAARPVIAGKPGSRPDDGCCDAC